jgi:hypothetical protein
MELVSYADVDVGDISDGEYVDNIIYRYPHLDYGFSLRDLERLVDTLYLDYDFRVAYCQATNRLPEQIQREILDLIMY